MSALRAAYGLVVLIATMWWLLWVEVVHAIGRRLAALRAPSPFAAIVIPSLLISVAGSLLAVADDRWIVAVWLACSAGAASAAVRVLW